MVKKLPCLYAYISQTKEGDRNTNLFKAINHLTYYNPTATLDSIVDEALSINKSFTSPLDEEEVKVICKHATSKNYRTSCWKFKEYCRHCRYGEFRKLWRNSKKGYWKHINENNRLVGIKLLPDDEFYPWDIEDISKITDIVDDKGNIIREKEDIISSIYQSREKRGIPIGIDTVVKAYGIPIGDKALREWHLFKKRD